MATHTLRSHQVADTAHVDVRRPPRVRLLHRDIGRGIWRVADPKITLASVSSIVLGAGVAAYHGSIAWGWLALTLLGIFFFEAAKNASGEIFDWDSGADQGLTDLERTPFSGGKRVLIDGLMTRRQTAIMAGVFYALGGLIGLVIMVWREPWVLALGVVGAALAFFYHAPPLKLSYRGLGEAAVALAYGPVIACGTYLVQRGDISPHIVWGSLPLGVAIMAFLWVNELPDARADAAAGKWTMVVRLGRRRAARAFALLVVVPYLGLLVLPLAGLPVSAWFGLIGLPLAVRAALRVWELPEDIARLVPAQGWTLLSFVLLAFGMCVGVVVA